MVTPQVYQTLPAEERRLWHSHVYEVKSGMLVMPTPNALPNAAWELAETKEMEQIVGLYGKTYHFWQVDRGDVVPMGAPELMMSFNAESNVGPVREMWRERDQRYGLDSQAKAGKREHIEDPVVHPGKSVGLVGE